MVIMGFMGYAEILLAILCFLFLSHLKNKGLPTNWPLTGMLPAILVNIHRIHDWSTQLLTLSGGTFLFRGPWFTNMNLVLTSDPSDIRYIMSTNFSNYPKGSEYKEIFDVLGDGIFNSDDDSWRTQRKVAISLIKNHKFQRFLEKTSWEKVENGLIPILDHVSKQGLVVDLQDLFKRFTFDSTSVLLSGVDPGCLSNELPNIPFLEAFNDVQEVIFYRNMVPNSLWKLQRWIGIGKEKKMSKACDILDDYLAQCISIKREQLLSKSARNKDQQRQEEDDKGMDLLSSYMEEEVEPSGPKSDNFLRDTILNLMLAGSDTVSASLAWFFWLVSTNPLVKIKIIEELKSLTSSVSEANEVRMFDMEELGGLVYLHGAFCEALRLFPSVPYEHKTPLCTDTLPSGHRVNPKTTILPCLYAMGRMEGIWGKDCLEFKPERWISEKGRIRYEPSNKFIAFNSGPRTCLGKDIAFTQIKLVAAILIYKYNFEVVEGHPVTPKNSIILHMNHGLKVRVTRRSI